MPCETCKYWAGNESSYQAACTHAESVIARPAFNDSCGLHTDRVQRRAITADDIASNTIGNISISAGTMTPVAPPASVCPMCGSANIAFVFNNTGIGLGCMSCSYAWAGGGKP